MFTGIITALGYIVAIKPLGCGIQLTIHADYDDLELGESIAVDGVCLTVTGSQNEDFCVHLSPETLTRTTFNNATFSQCVNLERALKVGDRLGGHWVQGHVETTLPLLSVQQKGDFIQQEYALTVPDMLHYVIPNGSITINGVSLTINEIGGSSFRVMVIPETLKRTNLNLLRSKDLVNVEFDYMAKVVARQWALKEATHV